MTHWIIIDIGVRESGYDDRGRILATVDADEIRRAMERCYWQRDAFDRLLV
jgi:YD repeat-containing protein